MVCDFLRPKMHENYCLQFVHAYRITRTQIPSEKLETFCTRNTPRLSSQACDTTEYLRANAARACGPPREHTESCVFIVRARSSNFARNPKRENLVQNYTLPNLTHCDVFVVVVISGAGEKRTCSAARVAFILTIANLQHPTSAHP